jgi:hypothetical protein
LDRRPEQSPLERFCALLVEHGVELRLREQEGLR